MVKKPVWNEISLHLAGGLDSRSVPADIPPGWFRNKVNFEITPTGQLKRRGGHERFYADQIGNYDHRHQGAARQPITYLKETTDASGVRRLFDGTKNRLSYLNESTGAWTDILSVTGSVSSRWRIDVLQNVVVASNGIGDIYQHTLGSGSASTIPDLVTLQVADAKVVITFSGFVFLLNFSKGGVPHPTGVRWSDLNRPAAWDTAKPDSLAGAQDLDYGDAILAAIPLYGALYVFTRRAIWKLNIVPSGTPVVTFTRVYFEPENQKGCLVYPSTLVTDGQYLYYASREAIYRYSPFVAAPERGDEKGSTWGDWLYRASGVIFSRADTLLSGTDCASPCAVYVPTKNELWFSWPALSNDVNNVTLVCQTNVQTADVVDHGYTALVNYRRTPTEGDCSERQDLLGVSGRDWAIKSIGKVFFREYVVMPDQNDPTVDPALGADYQTVGYNSLMRGLIPLGLTDRDKRVRKVTVDAQATAQDVPCNLRCRIGNSFALVDQNSEDPKCSPFWRTLELQPLECADEATIADMRAKNQRSDQTIHYKSYERGRFLSFEFQIEDKSGSEAIGGDSSFAMISFDSMMLLKL